MDGTNSVLVTVSFQEPSKIPVTEDTTVEDVIIQMCKNFKINPVARHLFALKDSCTKSWLKLSPKITTGRNVSYEFALRFNVPNVEKLRLLDENAYDFYFRQARYRILHNKVDKAVFEKYRTEIMGLSVIDMCRAVREDRLTEADVIRDYKKYVPSWAIKKHWVFLKKPIVDKFQEVCGRYYDTHFVKSGYLEQFRTIVSDYLCEEYPCLLRVSDGSTSDDVGITIRVAPFDREFPGISYKLENTDKWEHVCKIEDLCYIVSEPKGSVILNRRIGIPMYLKFALSSHMDSLLTLLNGYYRLMVKWTFNIYRECKSPSLTKLLENKCHGPVSGEFSYKKLELKCNFKAGCFILRESDTCYDTLYLDVCINDCSSPITVCIEITDKGEYKLKGREATYANLRALVAAQKSDEDDLPLKECLPPSEYDESNLLLCKVDNGEFGKLSIGREDEDPGTVHFPVCIDSKSLLVYKNDPKIGRNPHTVVYRAVWINRTKNIRREVAIKKAVSKEMNEDHLNQFLSLTSQWVFINSGAVTKLHGISLANPLAMVLEWFEDGPLDAYLSRPDNRSSVTTVNLVEASASLANALYYLEEAQFVHGVIRCRKLLVRRRENGSFIVKLTDPGIIYPYDDADLWWIPPEFYSNKDEARNSTNADVFAFGTTLWEIFSKGKKPAKGDLAHVTKIFDQAGGLPIPEGCPPLVYTLMRECWRFEPDSRKKPQAIMRDINQIFYQIFNSYNDHYSVIGPSNETRQRADNLRRRDGQFNGRSSSIMNTTIGEWDDRSSMNTVETDLTDPRSRSPSFALANYQDYQRRVEDESESSSYSRPMKSDSESIAESKLSITSMQSIYELDKEWSIVFNGTIGEGYYGEVYRGKLMHMYEQSVPERIVAVKVVKKKNRISLADFDREIAIMKKLKHRNIIKFEGILHEPDYILVMEFMELGALKNYLSIHKETLPIQVLIQYAYDIACGMKYLTDMRLVHRDLAARNILVASRNLVKISDFGLAQFIGEENYYVCKTSRAIPFRWYAPEALGELDRKFSVASDVWSYGVTLYEIFAYGADPDLPGVPPQYENYKRAFKDGLRLPLPINCPAYVYDALMMPCWEYEASKRASFETLCNTIANDIWTSSTGIVTTTSS